MDYREEIIKLVTVITQENVLQFFYSLLRVATSDLEGFEESLSLISDRFPASE